MANTVTHAVARPLADIWKRVQMRMWHDLEMAMGNRLDALRLRAKHPWLRLAGPKGRLP
jgi:hypothetical protein